jgi:phenylacetate-CoA ligase
MDLYGPLLAKALFPAFEAVRGRPTIGLLQYLHTTERWSIDALRDLQLGFLRRLLRHAYTHTAHYREVMDKAELFAEDLQSVDDLARLPLLDRTTLQQTVSSRLSDAPPYVAVTKTSSGTTGEPVVIKYNAESRHWRDASRWRGYGWGGYRIGMRAFHYWGFGPPVTSWTKRNKANLDHAFKRELFVDCSPRGDEALADAVAKFRAYKPSVVVAYAAGAAALARFVNAKGLRDWKDTPVLVGAERLWPEDRKEIERAFGPAFETYGAREVQLMGAECEAHDGLHTSMEMLVIEVIVRENGIIRAARPGETGEVCVTDLHNLACPMIRYVTGDLAVARGQERCACGRSLTRIGPIEGRITETMHDGTGKPVSGLLFSILFAMIGIEAKQFQVIQNKDRSLTVRLVLVHGAALSKQGDKSVRDWVAKYIPAVPLTIEIVDEIPLTAAGKRKLVIVET